jgi:hypothetical protein
VYTVYSLLGLGDIYGTATATVFNTKALAPCCSLMSKLQSLDWAKLRTPFIVFQILTQFISITGLQLPYLYQNFLGWADVLNFNVDWWSLPLGCVMVDIDFYDRLLIITLVPVALTALLLCTYTIARYRVRMQPITVLNFTPTVQSDRAAKLLRIRDKHHLAFLVMTFFIYSTVSTAVFQTFACDDVSGLNNSYLRADYSIVCHTREHKLYQCYAAVMILVYPIGIPLLYAYALRRNKHLLSIDKKDTSSSNIIHKLRLSHTELTSTRFLWQAYRPQLYYWEVIECVRRLMLTGKKGTLTFVNVFEVCMHCHKVTNVVRIVAMYPALYNAIYAVCTTLQLCICNCVSNMCSST